MSLRKRHSLGASDRQVQKAQGNGAPVLSECQGGTAGLNGTGQTSVDSGN